MLCQVPIIRQHGPHKDGFRRPPEDLSGHLVSRFSKPLVRMVARFTQHWEADADHWADFGSLEVPHLKCQTNNLLERFFQRYKYDFLNGKKCSSMQQVVCNLFDRVVPAYMHTRLLKQSGRVQSRQECAASRRQHVVDWLDSGNLQLVNPDLGHACAASHSEPDGSPHICCVADRVVTAISMPGTYVPMWKPPPAEHLSPMPCTLQLSGSLTAGNGWSLLEVGKAFSSVEAWQPQPLLSWCAVWRGCAPALIGRVIDSAVT